MKSAAMKLTHMKASSRTLLMIVHKLIDGSSVSGQMMLQQASQRQPDGCYYITVHSSAEYAR